MEHSPLPWIADGEPEHRKVVDAVGNVVMCEGFSDHELMSVNAADIELAAKMSQFYHACLELAKEWEATKDKDFERDRVVASVRLAPDGSLELYRVTYADDWIDEETKVYPTSSPNPDSTAPAS